MAVREIRSRGEHDMDLRGFVDDDPLKQGAVINGLKVLRSSEGSADAHTTSPAGPGPGEYSLAEILGEKLRALGDRCLPRDLYDVVNIHRRAGVGLLHGADGGRHSRRLLPTAAEGHVVTISGFEPDRAESGHRPHDGSPIFS